MKNQKIKCFALKVQDDSMIDVDIFEGDYVVVRQQPIAKNSDIVLRGHRKATEH